LLECAFVFFSRGLPEKMLKLSSAFVVVVAFEVSIRGRS
jgi:hypothetical protein